MVSVDASTMFGVFGHTLISWDLGSSRIQGKCCSSVSCQPVPQCVSISTSRYPPFSVVINISDRYLNRGPEIVQVTSTCTFFLMQQEVLLLTDCKVFFSNKNRRENIVKTSTSRYIHLLFDNKSIWHNLDLQNGLSSQLPVANFNWRFYSSSTYV